MPKMQAVEVTNANAAVLDTPALEVPALDAPLTRAYELEDR